MPGKAAHRREWEAIAALDPHWAVLAEPERKHHRWDEDEFFATGEREVAERLAVAAEIGLPCRREKALDFGCGLGRTARALAARFDHCVGIDISVTMLTRARELNAHLTNLELIRADGSEPLPFADESFDTVYSSIVLQHLPGHGAARAALRELARVTASDGLLCFQLPSALGLAIRLQPRRTAYRTLRAVRVPSGSVRPTGTSPGPDAGAATLGRRGDPQPRRARGAHGRRARRPAFRVLERRLLRVADGRGELSIDLLGGWQQAVPPERLPHLRFQTLLVGAGHPSVGRWGVRFLLEPRHSANQGLPLTPIRRRRVEVVPNRSFRRRAMIAGSSSTSSNVQTASRSRSFETWR